MPRVRLLALVLLAAAGARAAERTEAEIPSGYVQFRAGAAALVDATRPQLCLELAGGGALSVEGCGTGSGFLFRDDLPELAHFRAKWRLAAWELWGGSLEARVGAGFAELQIAEDAPGFTFGGVSETGAETSGPEASTFLRWTTPLGSGFEGIVEASLATAWLPAAPELRTPASPWQSSFLLTLGAGF